MTDKLQDLLKERDRFVERIRKASRLAEAASDRAAAGDPQELLSRYVARLQDARRAKDEAIARSDEEIRHYADLISDIESKLAEKRDGATDDTNRTKAYRRAGKGKNRTPK